MTLRLLAVASLAAALAAPAHAGTSLVRGNDGAWLAGSVRSTATRPPSGKRPEASSWSQKDETGTYSVEPTIRSPPQTYWSSGEATT